MKTETSDGGADEEPKVCVKKEETLELNISKHRDDLNNTLEVISIKGEGDAGDKDFLCKTSGYPEAQ